MRTIRRGALATMLTLLAVLGLCLAPLPTAQAQQAKLSSAFEQAPADPALLIVVPDLQALSKQLAALNDALGINTPELADVLGMMKQQMGLTKGLRDNGSLIIVASDAKALVDSAQNNSPPPIVALLPITSYDDFIGNFQGKDAGGVTELSFPSGETGFARKLGDYAVVGEQKDTVMNYKPANSSAGIASLAGKLGTRYLASSHASIFVNMKALSPLVKPMLDEAIAEGINELKANAGGPGAAGDMAVGVMTMYGNLASTVVRDTDAAVIGIDLDDRGAGATMTMQFRKDSMMAKVVGNGGASSSAKLLSTLPASPYIFASALSLEGMNLDLLAKEMIGDTKGPIVDIIKKAVPMLSMTQGYASLMTMGGGAPGQPPAIGPNMFGGVSVIKSKDPKAYTALFKSTMDEFGKMKINLAPPGADPNGPPMDMTFQTQYQANVLQIDGVSVDQYSVRYVFPPALMQQLGDAGPMLMMLGATGTGGYLAVAGDYVVMTSTPDPTAMKSGLAAAKAGNGLGNDDVITQVRAAGLPANPMFEGYVDVGTIVSTVSNLAAMFAGQPIPIQVPKNLPPIAMGGTIEDGGFANRLYMPRPVMLFIKDAVKQFQMMGGGPQDGRPRPAPF